MTKSNIILLGLTGGGKSTFGNLLLDTDFQGNEPMLTFGVSAGRSPCTKNCQKETVIFDDVNFNIIDTPGYRESDPINNNKNLINIIEQLRKLGSLNLVVICHQEKKVETKYFRDYLKHVRRLFGKYILEHRLVVLLTDSRISPENRDADIEALDNTVKKETQVIKEILQLDSSPIVGYIDTCVTDKEECERTLEIRKWIFDKAKEIEQVNIPNIRFSKLENLIKEHTKKLQNICEQRSLSSQRLEELNLQTAKNINETEYCINEIHQIRTEVNKTQKEIDCLNTEEYIKIGRVKRKGLSKIDIRLKSSEFPIEKVEVDLSWKKDTWKELYKNKYERTIIITSHTTGGRTGGIVDFYTVRKEHDKHKITELELKNDKLKQDIKRKEESYESIMGNQKLLRNMVSQYESTIQKQEEEIAQLSKDYFEIDDVLSMDLNNRV